MKNNNTEKELGIRDFGKPEYTSLDKPTFEYLLDRLLDMYIESKMRKKPP